MFFAKHPLIYAGIGDYEPTLTTDGIVWRKDTTGNPLCAVHVPSITNVRKFATLVRIEAFDEAQAQQQAA